MGSFWIHESLGILVNIFFNVGLTHIFSQEYNDSVGNKMIFVEYVLYLCLLFELRKLSCTRLFWSIFATTVRVSMIHNRTYINIRFVIYKKKKLLDLIKDKDTKHYEFWKIGTWISNILHEKDQENV